MTRASILLVASFLTACAARAAQPSPSDPVVLDRPQVPAWVTEPARLDSDLRAWYASAGDAQCSRLVDPIVPVYVIVDAITPDVVKALGAHGVVYDPEMPRVWALTGRLDRDAIKAVLGHDFVQKVGAIHCSSLRTSR